MKGNILFIFFLIFFIPSFGQVNILPNTPTPQLLNLAPTVTTSTNKKVQVTIAPNQFEIYEQNRQSKQTADILKEVEQYERQQNEKSNQLKKDINEATEISYNLPSFSKSGTEFYRNTFDKMLTLNVENYSVKDLNFEIEDAYFDNQADKVKFDQIIKNIGQFLLAKMRESKYDLNSNTAKNFILFQFFSETLNLKATNQKHLPFKYDFDDYMGVKDYSKMFVSKLLATGSGQCHSMPLLYLILAEEINAEAFLSFSPNHSYIRFRDEKNKWYNVELTNGMFTANTFILNSGFIKSEAMQNKIYMQALTKQELLSQFYVDLASGYVNKFGYDEFVKTVIDKALELYPNNIHAQMIKANYNTCLLKYVTAQLGIDPTQQESREKILHFPKAVEILRETQKQYRLIDDLGFEQMSSEAYEKWLASLKEAKHKQDNENFTNQFKGVILKKAKTKG